MNTSTHFLAKLLIPIRDNDGVPFQVKDWNDLEDTLFEMFNGYTMPGTVKGAWRDPADGKVYRDESRVYEIATTNPATVRALALDLKLKFRQEAIFVQISDVPVVAFV